MISSKNKQTMYLSSEKDIIHTLRDLPFCPLLSGLNRNIFVRYYTEYEFANAFLRKGTMKFNKFSHLRNLESKRRDTSEGESSFILRKKVSKSEKYDFRYLNVENDNLNVYCITYIDIQKREDLCSHEFIKASRYSNEERYAVVINEIDTFLNQVRLSFEENDFNFKNGYYEDRFVKYKNNKERLIVNESELNQQIFVKSQEQYDAENEFRIVNDYNFEEKGIQLIDIGSIEKYAYIIDLESKEIFSAVNQTFQYIVELCKINGINNVDDLNKKINETSITVGKAFKDNPNYFFQSLGFPMKENTETDVVSDPYAISLHNFDKYIKPYVQEVRFAYFTLPNHEISEDKD